MDQPTNSCPHCGGRLVSGAKNCLHCGALVAPGKTPAESESSSISATTIVVVLLVVLGGAFVLLVGTGGSKVVDAVGEPVTFDGPNVTSKICVSEADQAKIDEMQAAGWEEVEGKSGLRCFRD